MVPNKLDIHNYSKRHDSTLASLETRKGNKNNYELIKKFDNDLVHENIGFPRRIKIVNTLTCFSDNYLKIDFSKATLDDLKKCFTLIENKKDYSIWTKQSYKVIVRKFYKWLE